MTLCRLLCKPKDRVVAEDKNNVIYEIDCSNCQVVYSGESKRSLKSRSDEHERSFRNCDFVKNEIAKHCWEADHNFNWDQKKVIDRESRLIPRKIKETNHTTFLQVLCKRFCRNIPECLLREVHFSVTLVRHLRLFFVDCNDFPWQKYTKQGS